MNRFRSRLYFGVIVFLIFFIQGIWGLSDYGINWDETAHYLRGQAYVRFFLTQEKNYSNLPKIKEHYPKSIYVSLPKDIHFTDKPYRRSLFQYDREGEKFTYSYYIKHDNGHPPLNGILASFTNFIFFQKLGLVGDIEAYHLFIVFVSSFLVASVFLFTAHFYGKFAGIIAVFSLVLYPLFFAESHFNIKDPVEATFYSLTLFTFYIGIINNKWPWIMVSAIFAGFALGTKFNILFATFTIIPWIVIYHWRILRILSWPFSRSMTIALLIFPFIALSILFVSWPYLWQDPNNILRIFTYYKEIGSLSYQPADYYFLGVNTYAAQWTLFTTPIVIVIYSLIGIFYVVKHGFSEKNKLAVFIFLWLLVPIIRVSLPNSGIYGGLRQIMEFLPALVIFSGIGAKYIVEWLHDYIAKRLKRKKYVVIQLFVLLQLLVILSFVPIMLKIVSIHPHQNVYFNPLIGGLEGAKNKNFADWGVTLGSAYQEGVEWLNERAKNNANVALLKGLHANIPRTTLRDDINLDNRYYSEKLKKGEYIIEVTDYRWEIDIPKNIRDYLKTLFPVYEVKIDGVAILTIWKNDKEHTKKGY